MTTADQTLYSIKAAALTWAEAKQKLEAYANDCALSRRKIDRDTVMKLTAAYTAAERELEQQLGGAPCEAN